MGPGMPMNAAAPGVHGGVEGEEGGPVKEVSRKMMRKILPHCFCCEHDDRRCMSLEQNVFLRVL